MLRLSKIFEASLFWLVLFLLFFIPLYPKFPLINITGTFVAVRFEDFVIAGVLIIWGIYVLISGRWRELIKDPLIWAMLLFFGVGLVSLFSAYFITQTIKPTLGILHFLRRVEVMMLLPVAYTVIRSRRQLYFAMFMVSLVLVIVTLYAFGQQYLGWPVISTTNSEFSKGQILYLTPDARVNSTFAGHYDLAVFLVMAITVLTAMFFGLKKWWWQGWTLLLGGLSFVVLVMTAARLSFVAVVVGVACSIWLVGKKKFLILLVVLAVAALLYPSQLRDRFISTFQVNVQKGGERFNAPSDQQSRGRLNIPTLPVKVSSKSAELLTATETATVASDIAPGEPVDSTQLGVYRSFEIRLKVEWPAAWRAFLKNSLFGTGYSSLGLATDNDVLRSLAEVGLLGSLAFVLVLWAVWKKLWLIYSDSPRFLKFITAGTLAMVIAFVVNSLFIDVFEASKIATIFWLWIGINLSMERFRK